MEVEVCVYMHVYACACGWISVQREEESISIP